MQNVLSFCDDFFTVASAAAVYVAVAVTVSTTAIVDIVFITSQKKD